MPDAYLESAYLQDDNAFWLRGNLHTHTTRSDGRDSPQAMIDRYAELGYGFLGLSDHDVYGDVAGLDARGLVLLPGAELSGGPHVLDVGATKLVAAGGSHQELLDRIADESGLAVLCHPNWEEDYAHYPYQLLRTLTGFVGLEIFNGVVIDLAGNHLATDKWDRLLTLGRKVWGFANDDAHALRQIGRGWNVARVRQATPEAVLSALRTGSFYASSGVQIESVACAGPVLRISAPSAGRIVLWGQYSMRLHVCQGGRLDLDVSELESPYVRAECYGQGGDVAWTQPFFIRNGRFERGRQRLAELGALAKSVLHAFRADRPPAMTGRIDDPLWQRAESFDRFMNIKDGLEPPVKTAIRALLAGGVLYLSAVCEEPLLSEMKLSVQQDGQANLWADDSLEVFLDVEARGESCCHVMVNAAGFVHAYPRGPRKAGCPKVTAKAARWSEGKTTGWSVELAVPVEQLGAAADPGRRWGLHLCRNRTPTRASFVWSWVGSSNHNVADYGVLVF